MITELARRQFLSRSLSALGAAWSAVHWPAILAAADHAHKAAASSGPQAWEFFTAEEAREVEAIASAIIPTDSTPGAKEAGVVYFIDRALVTFAVDEQKTYRQGLPEIQKRLKELFPEAPWFSQATAEQQEAVLESLDEAGAKKAPRRPQGGFRAGSGAQPLFELLRVHTLAGFLIDPESDRKGNRGGVGWTVIGRLPDHSFEPPFGSYDKDYPGWQPARGKEAEKT